MSQQHRSTLPSGDSKVPAQPMLMTLLDGRQQLRGTGFFDRLHGVTELPSTHTLVNTQQHNASSTRAAPSTHAKANSVQTSGPTYDEQNDDGDSDEGQSSDSISLQRIAPRHATRLRWKHEQEAQRMQDEIALAARDGPATLKHLRVGSKAEKASVGKVFEHLQSHVEVRDTERVEARAAIENKTRKYYGFVSAIIAPSSSLLQSLWDHRRVGDMQRIAFSEKYFKQDAKNFVTINQEIAKYQHAANDDLELLRLCGLRDTILSSLGTLFSSPRLRDARTPPEAAEVLAIEIFNGVLQLRFVTCEIVDLVVAKRDAEGVLLAQPLMWEGENYLIRMQRDVAMMLSNTNADVLLGDQYPSHANPMMLPADLRRPASLTPSSTATPFARQKQQQQQQSYSPVPASSQSSLPTRVSLSLPTAVGLSPAPSPAVGGLTTSTHPGSRSGSRASPVVLLAPGQAQDEGGDEAADGGGGLSSKSMSLRNRFFKRQLSAIHRAANKIQMDRSNTYQYPASVYLPPERPIWARVGEMLRRSLDPRVASNGYNDVLEYERLQFGRITAPPSFHTPWKNPVVDESTQCFRTVIPDRQRFSASELHRREVIIFGEQLFVRSQRLRRRFRRGMGKLSMAYRGFVVMLQHKRRDSSATVEDFLRWVADVCPDWLEEARKGLLEAGSADDGIAQLIFADDIEDDV